MKYCGHCEKEFDTPEPQCPICGAPLQETDGTDEIVAILPLIGLL